MNEIPQCFEGKLWSNLTIDKFIDCPYNLAINRQTWMLSNISAVTCEFGEMMSDPSFRRSLLAIAKKNVVSLAYFGLLEYPMESQFVFEKTFGMEFIEPFQKWVMIIWNVYFARYWTDTWRIFDGSLTIFEGFWQIFDESLQIVTELWQIVTDLQGYGQILTDHNKSCWWWFLTDHWRHFDGDL